MLTRDACSDSIHKRGRGETGNSVVVVGRAQLCTDIVVGMVVASSYSAIGLWFQKLHFILLAIFCCFAQTVYEKLALSRLAGTLHSARSSHISLRFRMLTMIASIHTLELLERAVVIKVRVNILPWSS